MASNDPNKASTIDKIAKENAADVVQEQFLDGEKAVEEAPPIVDDVANGAPNSVTQPGDKELNTVSNSKEGPRWRRFWDNPKEFWTRRRILQAVFLFLVTSGMLISIGCMFGIIGTINTNSNKKYPEGCPL